MDCDRIKRLQKVNRNALVNIIVYFKTLFYSEFVINAFYCSRNNKPNPFEASVHV